MSKRMSLKLVDPAGYKAMLAFDEYSETTQLEQKHREMIRIRASQINGCSYCVDQHTHDARKAGETEQRIYALALWRDTSLFTEEEQAILALTEEVTLIHHHVSDTTYDFAMKILGEKKTAEVIFSAIIINAWNRIGVSTHMQPVRRPG